MTSQLAATLDSPALKGRRPKILPATLLLGLALAAPAQAVWSPVARVSPARHDAFSPVLGPGASGAVALLYNDVTEARRAVARTAIHPSGRRDPTRTAAGFGFDAAGLDARGNALLVRIVETVRKREGRPDQGYAQAQARTLSAGGKLGKLVRLTKIPGQQAFRITVAVNRSGKAIVAWEQRDRRRNHRIAVATGDTRSGVRRAGFVDVAGQPARRPAVALNAAGDAIVAFVQNGRFKTAERRAGGRFRRPVVVGGEAGHSGRPNAAVALAPDGSAVLAWMQAASEGETDEPFAAKLFAATRTGRGVWHPAEVLDESVPPHGDSPKAQLAPDGSSVVAWVGTDQRGLVAAQVAIAPAGSAEFSAPQRLGGSAASGPIDLAVASSGDVGLVWTEDGGRQVHAAVRAPRGSFVQSQIHGSPDRYVQHVDIAPSRAGRFVTAFQTRGTKAGIKNAADVRISRYEPGGGGN